MNIFGRWAGLDVSKLLLQLENSVINLEAVYNNPPTVNFDSPSIDWKQSLVEGDPVHPWHKCRYPEVGDFKTAKLYFVAIPRDKTEVVGDYSKWMKQLLTSEVDDDRVILPVHELQLSNVLDAFPEVQVLPRTTTGRPQSSLRTISVASPDFCIKVPLPIKITSIVRTIRPCAVTIGHRLEPVLQIIEKAVQDFGGSLIVAREAAAAASKSEHLGSIIRESTESIASRTVDRIIVCAAMVEHIDAIWGEDFDKTLLLREFCKQLFRVTLPSVLLYGFALQAHMQNLLIRIDPVTCAIKGFVARDLGSFRVHQPTFSESTALEIDTTWMLTSIDSLERVYAYVLGVIHADVDSLVRALRLGMEGWTIARQELERFVLPGDELARRVWLDGLMCTTHAHVSMQIYGVENEYRVASIQNRFYHCQFT
ncbi:hypothetical protein DL98DRAFT_464191 [Cadophora sp. DSE1049]|nr:hypothetical protein DL98DRAFT_464191 [Cadophora sp. DSE1049]